MVTKVVKKVDINTLHSRESQQKSEDRFQQEKRPWKRSGDVYVFVRPLPPQTKAFGAAGTYVMSID